MLYIYTPKLPYWLTNLKLHGMAFPLGALMTTTLLLFLVAFSLIPNVHATIRSSWGHAAHNMVGRDNKIVDLHKHHPVFGPGPWRQAYATFYEGGSGTFGTKSMHNL